MTAIGGGAEGDGGSGGSHLKKGLEVETVRFTSTACPMADTIANAGCVTSSCTQGMDFGEVCPWSSINCVILSRRRKSLASRGQRSASIFPSRLLADRSSHWRKRWAWLSFNGSKNASTSRRRAAFFLIDVSERHRSRRVCLIAGSPRIGRPCHCLTRNWTRRYSQGIRRHGISSDKRPASHSLSG